MIEADISSVAELALNAIGYSNVAGFDFDWNTTTNVMHISFSSAYNGDYVTGDPNDPYGFLGDDNQRD
ncbi:hypothetical protein, partial [uncultured Paraglaciecola sp.]|uniref:hypothetical protein n=1 Tax=uncultured Paraglaciecola sp. TaxID=1765024 RepID=UPI0025DCD912